MLKYLKIINDTKEILSRKNLFKFKLRTIFLWKVNICNFPDSFRKAKKLNFGIKYLKIKLRFKIGYLNVFFCELKKQFFEQSETWIEIENLVISLLKNLFNFNINILNIIYLFYFNLM